MALLHTPEKNDDFYAPAFNLKNIDGHILGWNDVKGENGTLIMFICNHCPYVKAVIDRLTGDCRKMADHGIGCAAIMPNDTEHYPEDSFDKMKEFARAHNFSFPYLIDETQQTARQYGAVCTPDFFGFNKDSRLEYRGRIDSAGPGAVKPDIDRELLNAMAYIAENGVGPAQQFPSMGCSIKWKA